MKAHDLHSEPNQKDLYFRQLDLVNTIYQNLNGNIKVEKLIPQKSYQPKLAQN